MPEPIEKLFPGGVPEPADIVFIGLGVVPLVLASLIDYKATWRPIRAAQQ